MTRYLQSWNNRQPWYFFAIQTPLDLLPWAVFLPAAGVLAWRGWRAVDERERTAARSSLVFVAIALVFFSISPGKRGVYLLPAFPVLALLLARVFVAPWRVHLGNAWRRVPLVALAGIALVLAGALPLAARRFPEVATPPLVAALALGALALAAGALASLRGGGRPWPLVFGTALLFAIAGTAGGAAWSRYQGGEAFGRRLAEMVPAEARLLVERGKFELVLYYARRRGTEVETDADFLRLAREGRHLYAVLERPTYDRLAAALAAPEAMRGRVSRTEYVVVGPLRSAMGAPGFVNDPG